MHKSLLLLAFTFLACNNPEKNGAPKKINSPAAAHATTKAFKLVSGNTDSAVAVFEMAGISVSFSNAADSMQTIRISQHGKQLINYIRGMDTIAATIPVPQLITEGRDTVVGFNISHQHTSSNLFFKIKNNKATYTKTIDTIPATLK
ncbi:hypothetical protein CLV51_1011354 [Chitinophaga niastensis]|uniref:Uncharacterized protein n=1 Tax=Chitinophaga niastensis TaxID=536980 RepID=A0A2P8HUV7_CHINA|nr:hypothetical protein [Chitinophaga niastensis]PSL50011.1 hypothetical protein CLV51_1011354 [Chitinophaga niastensis]